MHVVGEDRRANGGEWRYPGLQALVAHRLARHGRRSAAGLSGGLLGLLHRRLRRRVAGRYGIDIDPSATVGRRVRLIHQGGIVIGRGAVIGDGCWIRQGARIGGIAGDNGATPPVLGHDVQLGVGVAVADGVVVGDGAHLGPNGVVLDHVPPSATVTVRRHRRWTP